MKLYHSCIKGLNRNVQTFKHIHPGDSFNQSQGCITVEELGKGNIDHVIDSFKSSPALKVII